MLNKFGKPVRRFDSSKQHTASSKICEVGEKCEYWAEHLQEEAEYQGYLKDGLLTEKGLGEINKERKEEESKRQERELNQQAVDLAQRENIAVRKNPLPISSPKRRGFHIGVSSKLSSVLENFRKTINEMLGERGIINDANQIGSKTFEVTIAFKDKAGKSIAIEEFSGTMIVVQRAVKKYFQNFSREKKL